jgi:GDP-mannose 6-dehydrogenase
MNLCIFGLGYVGTVSLGCFARLGHRVVGVDADETKIDFISRGKAPIVEPQISELIAEQHAAGRISATAHAALAVNTSDISFVCVGTPSTPQGHLDLTAIYKVAVQIGEALRGSERFHVVAIRSTVLPGTNETVGGLIEKASGKKRGVDFGVVSNPEFLREGTALADFCNPPFTLLASESPAALAQLRELYQPVGAPVVETSIRVAEVIKYVNNAFHALKITFANEIGTICKSIDVDPRELMRIFCLDTKLNLSPYYLRPGFAFGGSCLPKDLRALATIAHDKYLKCPVIEGIAESNELHKEMVFKKIVAAGKHKIGFLGLSFKAGTDDLRNSPIIDVIEKLLGKGFDVRICDANVHLAQLKGANRNYILSRIPYIARFITDDAAQVVDHSELLVVVNNEPSFADALARVNGHKVVYDLVNLDFDGKAAPRHYSGVAW